MGWSVLYRTIIIIMIIIIIIAFKGAMRNFLTVSSLHREPSPTRTLKWPEHTCVQITCNTCNMSCYVPRGTKGQLSYWVWLSLKSHLFEFYFIGWTINRWRNGGNRSTWRKPLAMSFGKCHILQPEDSNFKRDHNYFMPRAMSSIDQNLIAEVKSAWNTNLKQILGFLCFSSQSEGKLTWHKILFRVPVLVGVWSM